MQMLKQSDLCSILLLHRQAPSLKHSKLFTSTVKSLHLSEVRKSFKKKEEMCVCVRMI